jgi:hypothetical protein
MMTGDLFSLWTKNDDGVEGIVAGIAIAASLIWVLVRTVNQKHDSREWRKRARQVPDEPT